MNGYPSFPQRPFPANNNGPNMMDMSGDGMNFGAADGQSLDDIVAQNDKANRRKSMPVYGGMPMQMDSPDPRRLSMMDFGNAGAGNLDDFQFNMQPGAGMDGMMRGGTAYPRTSSEMQNDRVPTTDLAINTQFSNQNSPFPTMQAPGSAYASPLHPSVSLDMDMASPYPNTMSVPLDINDPSLAMMGADMNMFSGTQFPTPMMDSPINQDFVGPMPPLTDPGATSLQPTDHFGNRAMSATSDTRSSLPTRTNSQEQSSTRSSSRPQSEQHQTPKNLQNHIPSAPVPSQDPAAMPPQQDISSDTFPNIKFPWTTPPGMTNISIVDPFDPY